MVIDRVENWGHYPLGSAWRRAFEFLHTLTPESPDMKYPIDGENIFAIVMSYDTCAPETSVFESHQKYIDIQTVLRGGERFECAFKDDLVIDIPYQSSKDITLYKRTRQGQTCIDVFPGTFVMLYPHDAHIASLMINEKSEYIKKVVIKIKTELVV